MNLLLDRIASPLGTILLVSDGTALRALDFEDYQDRMHRLLHRHYGGYTLTSGYCGARDQLESYFAGDLAALDTIAVQTAGTEFQHRVWSALRAIPPGSTASYGDIAARIGVPAARRAVGLANGANPVAIVVPCHRVIGADGRLTGYGGGLHRKSWLLRHEAAILRSSEPGARTDHDPAPASIAASPSR
ncbi:methylated-DNA--[protein]-cysteine S-methyltransferase [Acidiphilium sp. AL]|uniref:Methylated-DNA--protein-cysteine methyltransferase n=1 Tax=Acidiphilium iwatense TaxID=768198 RepID=A0ABS9DWQ4_9PROT|nr:MULTISPECIES: methylated-DNA--[protein]-cysteine S-methyltransferase [Acidiphilium]MCF3947166.1 methylated-DNA--[protein]-cysteine S-methyltransferase [Acidiphilium iwatense]MCU4160649.1 methylated-DNA--[protein]-cysteine S-methyltransferase [Acidiphilium sp. AL]